MPYVLLGLAVFGLITSTVFAAIVLWAVPRFLGERRTALTALAARPGFTPRISVFKPLSGTWANDFPHSDSTWPWSQEVLAKHTKNLSETEKNYILHDNAAELYHLN